MKQSRMKQKKRISETNVTASSYILSLAFHALLFLLISLAIIGGGGTAAGDHPAGKAAGVKADKSIPISMVYVPAKPRPAGGEETSAEETAAAETQPEIHSEIVIERVERPTERTNRAVRDDRTERSDSRRGENRGDGTSNGVQGGTSDTDASRPEKIGDGGIADGGQGSAISPFPNGAFGKFDVDCSKGDENRGVSGESVFDVVFQDGKLDATPSGGSVVGDTGTIKKAIRNIIENFHPEALPSGAGGVIKGKIVCRYARCEVNECSLIK